MSARVAGRAAPLVVLLLLVGGCGYSLRGNLPPHIRTVAVPVFTNKTSLPAVENSLTRAVVNAFTTNGRLRVVRPEEADSILEGDIIGYDLMSTAFDPTANVRQYRLVVTLNLKFRDARRGGVLFERAGLQERADFSAVGAASENIAREETALQAAATEIARSIVSLAIERF